MLQVINKRLVLLTLVLVAGTGMIGYGLRHDSNNRAVEQGAYTASDLHLHPLPTVSSATAPVTVQNASDSAKISAPADCRKSSSSVKSESSNSVTQRSSSSVDCQSTSTAGSTSISISNDSKQQATSGDVVNGSSADATVENNSDTTIDIN